MEDWSREGMQTLDGKVNKNIEVEEEEGEEEEEDYENGGIIVEEGEKMKGIGVMSVRRGSTSVGRVSPACCQAEGCGADLTFAKRYHRRHKVCELHSKAPVVIVAGLRKRFCQQCSRFHELAEFDEAKRSCRRRLARHNERRRKSSAGTCNEGSSVVGINEQQHPSDQSLCANDNVVDWRKIQMNMAISSSHKFFKFR